MTDSTAPELSFTLQKVFAAPRDLVFEAWTDPVHLTSWYPNPEFANPEPITVDLRVGGAWRVNMVIDNETSYITGGIYREIVKNERIVFTWGAPDGWPEIDPEHPEEAPLATLDFRDGEPGTTIVDFHLDIPEAKFHPFMQQGWSETIDRLVAAYA